MNPPSLTRHLLLKDLRHQRLLLAALWACAVALPFIVQHYEANRPPGANSLLLVIYGFFLITALVLARTIRLDAPGRVVHFLATRPVPGGALFTSKILFASLFLATPVLVTQLGVIFVMRIPVNAVDVALVLVEMALYTGAIMAGAALVALYVRSLPAILVCLACGFVFGSMAGEFFLRNPLFHSKEPWKLDYSLVACRVLVFYICIIATACVVAWLRYSKRRALSYAALAAGLVLSAVAWAAWPFNPSRLFSSESLASRELPEPMRSSITLTLTGTENKDNNLLQDLGEMRRERYRTYSHMVFLAGLQPPYFATMADYRADITLKSGRVIHSEYGDVNAHGGVGGLGDDLRFAVAGAPLKKDEKWGGGFFEMLNFFPGRYPNEDLTGASVKGTLTFEIRKVVLVKTAPFRAGATADFPRQRYLLDRAEYSGNTMSYNIIRTSMKSVLRGWPGYDRDFSMLIYNPSMNARAASGGSGGDFRDGFFCDVNHLNGDSTLVTEDYGKPMSAAWMDGAKISFFTTEPCGRITLPYEIKSVDLKR